MGNVKNGNIAINLKNYSSKVDEIFTSDGTQSFFKKYKVSRPEAPWVIFYRPGRIIYRPDVISWTKRACTLNFALQNTLSQIVIHWTKIVLHVVIIL